MLRPHARNTAPMAPMVYGTYMAFLKWITKTGVAELHCRKGKTCILLGMCARRMFVGEEFARRLQELWLNSHQHLEITTRVRDTQELGCWAWEILVTP